MPRTSVKIWQRSARRAAASATAVVSLPPRPRVVISWSCVGAGALALEPGDDHDLAALELGPDAARLDAGDAGPAVRPVGRDAGLRPGQADGADPDGVEGHRQERGALVLAGGEQDVELARIGFVGDRRGEAEQLVRRVAHRRDDDDEVVAGRPLARDPPRDALDAVGAGHGRATELLDDEGGRHRPAFYRGTIRHPTRRTRGGSVHVLRPRQPTADPRDRRRRARRAARDR